MASAAGLVLRLVARRWRGAGVCLVAALLLAPPGATGAATPSAPDHPIDWQRAPPNARGRRLPAEGLHRHLEGHPKTVNPNALLRGTLEPVLEHRDPFFRDLTLSATIRSAYFRVSNGTDVPMETWALGGNLLLETGWWRKTIRLELQPYFSEPVVAPEGRGGARLVRPNQDAINVVGQAFLEARFGDHHLKAYRQAIDTPFVNEHFDRMIPNLFEAYLLRSSDWHGLSYIAGFITREKTRDSSSFRWMSDVARNEVPATHPRPSSRQGVAIVGGQYALIEDVKLSLYDYFGVDMFNTFYAELSADHDLSQHRKTVPHLDARVALQFSQQNGVGSASAGPTDSTAGGAFVSLGYEGFVLGLGITRNSGDGIVRHPWGRYPGFNKSIVLDFNRAGEQTYGIWLSHDFGHDAPDSRLALLRVPGLGVATSWVLGKTPKTGPFAAPDEREFDVTIDYRFHGWTSDWMKGLWLRARFAFIGFDGLPDSGPTAINDYRFILNYDLPPLL